MKKYALVLISASLIVLTYCSTDKTQKSKFEFIRNDQGVELIDNGKPVFFYQQKPKTLTGEYVCSNYIHPLYNLKGDTLTEEFPPDHPYHRGVFWTWHQIFVDTVSIGDGWINDGISQDVKNVILEKSSTSAEFNLDVLWKSSNYLDGKPFMNELTTIIIHPIESGTRKIDFEITLKALVNDLQIGGSSDEKGYGGFCVRLKVPDNLVFTSEQGAVTPRELQIIAGPWMDFSGSFGNISELNGLTMLCHPQTPGYPEPWILRQKGSMQNIVYPGRDRIIVPVDKPLVLKYRLVIHDGNSQSLDINSLQAEYSKK